MLIICYVYVIICELRYDVFNDMFEIGYDKDCECLLNPPHLNGVKVILFIIK